MKSVSLLIHRYCCVLIVTGYAKMVRVVSHMT